MCKRYIYDGTFGRLILNLNKKKIIINELDKEKLQILTHKKIGKDNSLILNVLITLIARMFKNNIEVKSRDVNSTILILKNKKLLYINIGENEFDEMIIKFI